LRGRVAERRIPTVGYFAAGLVEAPLKLVYAPVPVEPHAQTADE